MNKVEKDKICLASEAVELSETELYLEMKNRLCYYGEPNLNDVILPIEGAEEKAQTLLNMPVVAKYRVNQKGEPDLGGHEPYIDRKTGKMEFKTESIGTHISVEVKEDTVDVMGEQKVLPCLFATSRIWTRNKNIVAAIKRLFAEGKLFNSWEVIAESYKYEGGLKTLVDYVFAGNCLLGDGVLPAYGSASRALDLSTRQESEMMVAEAFAKDVVVSANEEETMEEKVNGENQVIVTEEDIIEKPEEEIEEPVAEPKEDETNPEEEVQPEENPEEEETSEEPEEEKEEKPEQEPEEEVEPEAESEPESEPEPEQEPEEDPQKKLEEELNQKTSALAEAATRIANLEAEIAELTKYKTWYEEAEEERQKQLHEEKEAELSAKALKSKLITSNELENDEEIKRIISELDETALNNLIASRYMKAIEDHVETSEVHKKQPTRKLTENTDVEGISIFRAYLSK